MKNRVLIVVFAVAANTLLAQGTFHWTWTTQTGTPFECSFDTTWDEVMTPGTSWNEDPFIRNSFTITDAFGVTLASDPLRPISINISGSSGNPLDPTFNIQVNDWSRYLNITVYKGSSYQTISQSDRAYPYASQGYAIGSWDRVLVPEPSFPALLVLGGLAFWVGRRILVNRRVPF